MLETLDRQWTLAINSIHCPFSDSVWMLFSDKHVWFFFYAIIAGIIIWRLGWRKGLIMIVSIALCIVCVDQGCNVVKDYFQRLRPCNDPLMYGQGLHILEAPHSYYKYGFFSAHAGNAFAFATASSIALRMDKRLKWRGYVIGVHIWALLVAASRIFVGKHFLGDVMVGIMVGVAVALVICTLARLLVNKLKIK